MDSFIRKSQEKLLFLDDMCAQALPFCTNITICKPNNYPSTELVFDFAPIIQQGIMVKFRTKVAISKVANIFYMHHEFELPLNGPGLIAACLDGYDASAYTFEQQDFEEFIVAYLAKLGLKRITLYEFDEVIDSIPVPENKLFGSQMTVENALFRDLYGFCEQ